MIKISAAVAHPWLCDAMGHLNTRHYFAMFDDAPMVLLAQIAGPAEQAFAAERGWADVRNEVGLGSARATVAASRAIAALTVFSLLV